MPIDIIAIIPMVCVTVCGNLVQYRSIRFLAASRQASELYSSVKFHASAIIQLYNFAFVI